MEVSIRKGKEQDVHALLQLIQELAEYEKAPHEVVVTEEQLLQDGFGPQAVFDFFVAKADGQTVGIALYYTKYSTWKGKCIYLEDLVVKQEFRSQGVGEMLFLAVKKVAEDLKVKRMEWQVLSWNTPAIAFYQKHGAFLDNEWINGKFEF